MSEPSEVVEVLEFFNYQKELIIVEFNGKIYNRLNHTSKDEFLKQNDKIEIITIVGGG